MSNAEQERIEKAWEEAEIPIDCVLGENKWAVMKNGFRYGFLAGRADALDLPDVRAEELVMGEWYLGKNILINKWDVFQHDQNTAFTIQYAVEQFSFRGPLPLGGGE